MKTTSSRDPNEIMAEIKKVGRMRMRMRMPGAHISDDMPSPHDS